MNDVFANLILMARTGQSWEAAQAYSNISGLPLEETRRTMQNIYKTFHSIRVRNANKPELEPDPELLEMETE